ncbi:energy transducer TonB [bacterium AH-315-C20]|nr:energy transducer TonB [bacterium AH-315-C20]
MKIILIFLFVLGLAPGAFSLEPLVPPDSTVKKPMIYDYPEIMPQFPGGADALDQFIKINAKTPVEAKRQGIKGKVYVQFVIEKDGKVAEVDIRMGKHDLLNQEALRVVKMMPDWKPGTNKGKKVRVRYTLPITFH